MKMKKIAGMSSFMQRKDVVFDAVNSLANQVDIISLYLNDYDEIPDWASKFDNLVVTLGKNAHGDIADSGKFYFADKEKGFYFCVDDDFIYPSGYCEHLIEQYNVHGGIVGLHGVKIKNHPVHNYYYFDDFYHYAWSRSLSDNHDVDIIGTGVCMFNTNEMKISIHDFVYPLMTDIYFSIHAKLQNIKRTVISHSDSYIKYNTKMENKWTICNEFSKNNDDIQTYMINSICWSSEKKSVASNNQFEKLKIMVQFPTLGRPKKFIEVLDLYYDLLDDKENTSFNIVIDETDLSMNNNEMLHKILSRENCKVTLIPHISKIYAINSFDSNTSFDILLVASDDMIPIEKGYDTIIRNEMKNNFPNLDGVLWFYDGYRKDLNTLTIMGKKYYEKFGYIYYPEYKSYFCDAELMIVANSMNKQVYIDKCIIRHDHFTHVKGHPDETERTSGVHYANDSKLYYEREKRGFDIKLPDWPKFVTVPNPTPKKEPPRRATVRDRR
jgi:hypothetical protein